VIYLGEFNVELIEDVKWNEGVFDNLVLPSEKKNLLLSLVEAHNNEVGFDDFITGKGQGLVINFSGPAGVGKTFCAEAMSEHLRRPLYVIGRNNLGPTADSVYQAIRCAFDLAAAWKAIILIDEADLFPKQSSKHDSEQNTQVAVLYVLFFLVAMEAHI